MPTRSRSHILEEQSIRRFVDTLPAAWVYRSKSPDYGIDGEVEIYNGDGSATGLTFNVQLRGTDNAARSDTVRLKVDQLNYFLSFDVPTVVARYNSSSASFFWQWAPNIASRVNVRELQKSFIYRFNEGERWTDETPLEIRKTLEVRRQLSTYPPGMAVSLRIDLSAMPAADRYTLDRAIALAIADSHGAIIRANDTSEEVEAFVRLRPESLVIGIDTLTSVTVTMYDHGLEDYLASILYALVRLFRGQRLVRQSEALAMLLAKRSLRHHDSDLAFNACLALARDLPALVRLAVVNDLHKQNGIHYSALTLTIAQAPQDEGSRRMAMEAFFDASIDSARGVDPVSEAAAHYSIGNFYRARKHLLLAVYHYNRARKLRPAYLDTGYFLEELGGALFLAGHYKSSVRAYCGATLRIPDDPDLAFLLADALLLAGFVTAARSCFEEASVMCKLPRMNLESQLKIIICDYLIGTANAPIVPRRRAEANLALSPDGRDSAAHLEHISRAVDAMNPVARFNIGVTRAAEGNSNEALFHFLLCAITQPGDVEAWANAVICALPLDDEILLLRILSVAIHCMGTEAYDQLRRQLIAQSVSLDMLNALDELVMRFLEEYELPANDGFTLRMLDGDGYRSFKISGFGTA